MALEFTLRTMAIWFGVLAEQIHHADKKTTSPAFGRARRQRSSAPRTDASSRPA
jgi:hypothetical protein